MRRSDQEPLLFDLPLDRPARDDQAEDDPQDPRQARDTQRKQRGDRAAARGQRAAADLSDPADRMDRAGRADPTYAGDRAPGAKGRAGSTQATPSRNQSPQAAGRTPTTAATPAPADPRAGVGRRLAAGAADLLIHAAVGILTFVACHYLGVFPIAHDWPAGAVFLVAFSFLYTVIPLAFWGHTLGMTWAGLTSQSTDGEPLSFDQTARRWLGALLTLATLGLPTLLALTGRSLADRLSGSHTSLSAPAAR
jgi:uncharacterized RDD family membrane protein YckC